MTLFGHQFQISLTHFILYYVAIIGMQTVIVYLGETSRSRVGGGLYDQNEDSNLIE